MLWQKGSEMTSFFKSQNMWLLAASVISFATTGLHVIGGTPEIMSPLYVSNAPKLSIGIAEVMWNQITLLLAIGSWVYWRAASRPQIAFDLTIAMVVLYLGITLLFIGSGLNMFASLWVMPQWILFLAMATLAIIGLVRTSKSNAV